MLLLTKLLNMKVACQLLWLLLLLLRLLLSPLLWLLLLLLLLLLVMMAVMHMWQLCRLLPVVAHIEVGVLLLLLPSFRWLC